MILLILSGSERLGVPHMNKNRSGVISDWNTLFLPGCDAAEVFMIRNRKYIDTIKSTENAHFFRSAKAISICYRLNKRLSFQDISFNKASS